MACRNLQQSALQPAHTGRGARRHDGERPREVAAAPDGFERQGSKLRGAVGRAGCICFGEHKGVLDLRCLEEREHLQVRRLQPHARIDQYQHQLEGAPLVQIGCRELAPGRDSLILGKCEAI